MNKIRIVIITKTKTAACNFIVLEREALASKR